MGQECAAGLSPGVCTEELTSDAVCGVLDKKNSGLPTLGDNVPLLLLVSKESSMIQLL